MALNIRENDDRHYISNYSNIKYYFDKIVIAYNQIAVIESCAVVNQQYTQSATPDQLLDIANTFQMDGFIKAARALRNALMSDGTDIRCVEETSQNWVYRFTFLLSQKQQNGTRRFYYTQSESKRKLGPVGVFATIIFGAGLYLMGVGLPITCGAIIGKLLVDLGSALPNTEQTRVLSAISAHIPITSSGEILLNDPAHKVTIEEMN